MTQKEIIIATEKSFSAFTNYCNSINDAAFFNQPGAKWTIAQNVEHLIIATKTAALAFTLPKFLVRWVGGTPNRKSRTYEEIVAKYKNKLAAGGAAGGRFIPKKFTLSYGKQKMMFNWNNATINYLTAIQKNSNEATLDNYLVRHPLLGRITLRELCYFTIYHTEHHLKTIAAISPFSENINDELLQFGTEGKI